MRWETSILNSEVDIKLHLLKLCVRPAATVAWRSEYTLCEAKKYYLAAGVVAGRVVVAAEAAVWVAAAVAGALAAES